MKTIPTTHKILVMTCLSAVIGLAGCQPEDATEKAEKKIEAASELADKTIDKSHKAADNQIKGIEKSLDENAEQAKDTIDQSTDNSKEMLEKSEDNVDNVSEQAEEKVEQIKDDAEKKLDDIKAATPVVKPEVTGENLDDSMITLKVKTAIMGEALLNASHINVDTVNGVVKLSGTVDSEKNIVIATKAANSQKGVSAVQSDLTVDIKNK
ncbi:BON domain-containing protein [Crenothrix polyspora]|uniref:Transport-associated protein n=1 Tax=Crenothrix polyspora TaxID=360316 RepID=A0A1R4GZA6_9GAMM|nr:BON domain-containing protein [Crenothrix polyspora]SJM89301.1 Transport-associated protein [Crenothrix polyspora]